MANWSQDAVDALAAAVVERREYVGRSQIEVWQNGGPANSTMTSIEKAQSLSVTPGTLRKLDVGLEWVPETAAKVLRDEVNPSVAARDLRYDARRVADIKYDTTQILSEQKAQKDAVDRERAAEVAAAMSDYVALIAALSVDADDLRSTTDGINVSVSDFDDEDEVERLASEAEELLEAVRDFAQSVDEVVAVIFAGDPDRLQRLKRETRRFRRQQAMEQTRRMMEQVRSESSTTAVYDPAKLPPGPRGALLAMEHRARKEKFVPTDVDQVTAARKTPPGYILGQSEQGDADGEESQDDPR